MWVCACVTRVTYELDDVMCDGGHVLRAMSIERDELPRRSLGVSSTVVDEKKLVQPMQPAHTAAAAVRRIDKIHGGHCTAWQG